MTDAQKVLESLSADELRQQIEVLDREQQALRVLLRAALTRDKRREPCRPSATAQEVRP